MNDVFPQVVQAVAGENYIVYAYMLDGSIRKVDIAPFIKLGGVFEKLSDKDFFKNALTVMNNTVAWDVSGCFDTTNCIDIDPVTISECEAVNEPLKTA